MKATKRYAPASMTRTSVAPATFGADVLFTFHSIAMPSSFTADRDSFPTATRTTFDCAEVGVFWVAYVVPQA